MNFVIYASKRANTTTENDIDHIFTTAEKLNKLNEISGLLLVNNDYFLQYFEGEKTNVDSLLDRLSNDHRHHDLKVLDRGSIDFRLFPYWEMAEVHLPSKKQEYAQIIKYCPRFNLKNLLHKYLIKESPLKMAYF